MILSRTPLRISFVGGGTDIPNFYQRHGGEVISTAIDKYISVRITRQRNRQIAVNTPHHCETVSDPDHIQHPLIREAVRKAYPPSPPLAGGLGRVKARGLGRTAKGLGGVDYPSR